MTIETLLPPNATATERALEEALRPGADVVDAIDRIRTAKESPPDDWLLWLVWEYGLEGLLPYLNSPRDAVEKGVLWQSIRGTPESLRLALSWINVDAEIIEGGAGRANWFNYQINPGRVPTDEEIAKIVGLANLSAPVGTRLSRLTYGYDRGPFILDRSKWGDILSGASGYYDPDLGTWLSFGRVHQLIARLDTLAVVIASLRVHTLAVRHETRFILDRTKFGFKPVIWPRSIHSHLSHIVVTGLAPDEIQPKSTHKRISRAAITLSSGSKLEHTNTRFGRIGVRYIGAPLILSGAGALGDGPTAIEYFPIFEVSTRKHRGVAHYARTPSITCMVSTTRVSFVTNPTPQAQPKISVTTTYAATAAVSGQYWSGVLWGAEPWNVTYIVRVWHHGDTA